MIINRHLSHVEVAPNPHGVMAKKIHDSEHAQIVHIDLAPGEKLKRHATPVDVCFYVLHGTGTIYIGDESVEVGPDTLVESPARIVHWFENSGKEPFKVLVLKTPRPQSKTRLL